MSTAFASVMAESGAALKDELTLLAYETLYYLFYSPEPKTLYNGR